MKIGVLTSPTAAWYLRVEARRRRAFGPLQRDRDHARVASTGKAKLPTVGRRGLVRLVVRGLESLAFAVIGALKVFAPIDDAFGK